MAVTVNPQILMKLSQTISVDGAGSQTISFSAYDRKGSKYDASSTQVVDTMAADELTLTGSDTIDLTAAPDILSGTTVDFTGKAIVIAYFVHSSGTNTITIAEGASNGYQLQSTHSIILQAGGKAFLEFNAGLGNVAAADKTLDITGTSSEKLRYILVGG